MHISASRRYTLLQRGTGLLCDMSPPIGTGACISGAHHASLQAETDEVDAFVGTIGRRLTALRRLALFGAQHLSEAAMQHLSGERWAVCMRRQRALFVSCCCHVQSPREPDVGATHRAGLTALTELCIMDAHDFGGRALEALRPLTGLRRLALSETTLNPVALAAVLDEEEDSGTPMLPALTFLELRSCRLLRWGCSWAEGRSWADVTFAAALLHLQSRMAGPDQTSEDAHLLWVPLPRLQVCCGVLLPLTPPRPRPPPAAAAPWTVRALQPACPL